MKVSDIVVKKVITASGNDTIAKVLTRMSEHKIHQLPVVQDGSVIGMILLKHLLGRDYNPAKTPAKNFLFKVPHLSTEMSLDDAIIQIVKSGVRALPVIDGNELIGILSEADLIKHVEYVSDIPPEKLMSSVISVTEKDNLDKVMALMRENSISRLPVISFEEKLLGCVDNLDLIKFLMAPQESPRYSELTAVEKESLKTFYVKDHMRNTYKLEKEDFSLKKVIDALQKHEEVVLTTNGKPIGIIVPKDVLELSQFGQQYPVYVSHLNNIDSFEVSVFQELLAKFMEKFEKMFNIQKLFIYADTQKKKEAGRNRVSLRAKVITNKRIYLAKSQGWGLKEAAHILLDNFEKQLIKNHEKHLDKTKRRIKG